MSQIRKPAVAGLFYPEAPLLLQQQLEGYLDAAEVGSESPKALIVPHAGYAYSGPTAAYAYRQLDATRGRIKRVILLGPAHRVDFPGLAVSSAQYFDTPLGLIPIDQDALDSILLLPQVRVFDEAHREEHSLEVQLPFLQQVLGNQFKLLPLVVGEASSQSIAEVLDILWGGDETLLLISSDLSHYEDYNSARRLDQATSQAITQLNPDAIDYHQACGRNPISGLLLAARRHHLQVRVLDLRNSGDTAGNRDRVVGYGAYVFY
ncbi:COG1355, Predicted dioxygenase [hydrothermal vent metagenome]|uniref:COG1355, Predicted dioxygenase n=1 Tax=hydrothermal vent metagenome TaxID=652676 RepID=A0A3B0YAW8_9ZZZZ